MVAFILAGDLVTIVIYNWSKKEGLWIAIEASSSSTIAILACDFSSKLLVLAACCKVESSDVTPAK